MGQKVLTLSGTPDFTPFGGVHYFTHSLYMHYIIYLSKDYVYGLMVCLPELVFDCFVVDFFCDNDKKQGCSLDKSASH